MGRLLPWVLAVALALAGCGGGGSGDDVATTSPATTAGAGEPGEPGSPEPTDAPRASPRWETVNTFTGSASLDPPGFHILPGAIQWRIRWTCESGRLRITSTPPPRRAGSLVESHCPGKGDAYSIQTGATRLSVEASGPWKAIVDQQIDTPLDEPLPPEVAAAPVVARGSFYPMEREGRGEARIHLLEDGRRVLRLEGFEVSQNTDLFVWLSELPRPSTSAEALNGEKVSIGNLKSTVGNQNYDVPPDLPTERIRSVVIWCEPVAIAYSAASLSS